MTIRDLPYIAAIVFVASVIPLGATLGICEARFIRRIRQFEPALWQRLGCPSVFSGLGSNKWTISNRGNQYFYERNFSSISDASARRLAKSTWLVRRFFLCYVIGVGSIIGATILLLQWHVI